MKKRLSRKGDYELYFFIFALIAVGMVALAFLSFKTRVEEADLLDAQFISRDLAMLTGSGYAAPGNFWYSYSGAGLTKFRDFDYSFKENVLTVAKASRYPYSVSRNFLPVLDNIQIDKPSKVYLVNSNWQFYVTGEFDEERYKLNLLKYPLVDTADSEWRINKKLFFDSNVKEPAVFGLIFGSLGDKKDKDYDVYVFVEVDDKISSAEAYVPPNTALKSRKLALMMINELIEKGRVKEGSIFVSDNLELASAKEAAVLLKTPKPLEIEEVLGDYYG